MPEIVERPGEQEEQAGDRVDRQRSPGERRDPGEVSGERLGRSRKAADERIDNVGLSAGNRVTNSDIYVAMEQVFLYGKPWSETRFYNRILTNVLNGRPLWGCNTEEERTTKKR